jgi:hypothetical protein
MSSKRTLSHLNEPNLDLESTQNKSCSTSLAAVLTNKNQLQRNHGLVDRVEPTILLLENNDSNLR